MFSVVKPVATVLMMTALGPWICTVRELSTWVQLQESKLFCKGRKSTVPWCNASMRICVKKVGALNRRLHYRAVTSPHFYKWRVVDPVGTALRRRVERGRMGRHCNQTAWKPSRYVGCRNCRKTIRYPFLLSSYFLHSPQAKKYWHTMFSMLLWKYELI